MEKSASNPSDVIIDGKRGTAVGPEFVEGVGVIVNMGVGTSVGPFVGACVGAKRTDSSENAASAMDGDEGVCASTTV